MPKIKNKLYNEFLDKGQISLLTIHDIKTILSRIEEKNTKQARSLLITLYLTGARPCEVLQLRSKDITKERNYLIIQTKGAKNGLNRPIRVPYKLDITKELWQYSTSVYPDMYLFHAFQSNYRRTRKNKKGDIIEYHDISNKIRYYFNKWTDGLITPYFLRHNRFSQLSLNGIRGEDIRLMKGAKTMESVIPYLHMSKEISQKIARKIE